MVGLRVKGIYLAIKENPKGPMPQSVNILLATHNGARYLPEQLQSYSRQGHKEWCLWASDDGSTDKTLKHLQDFAQRSPVQIVDGPQKGAAANFMSLLCHPDLPDAPVALSDQDDVWLSHRLERGLARLAQHDGPALYCSRTMVVDPELKPLGFSPNYKSASFENAIVQNIASGHTIMLNTHALHLIRQAGIPNDIPYHDWWTYLLITAAGGTVVFDKKPGVMYRQHSGNHSGAHHGLGAIIDRIRVLKKGGYRQWISSNLSALQACTPLITSHARDIVDELQSSADWKSVFTKHDIRRQGKIGQAMLGIAFAMNWL